MDQRPIIEPKEIALGQWFPPFENYGNTPSQVSTARNQYIGKNFPLTTPGVGKWALSTKWSGDDVMEEFKIDRGYSLGGKYIILLPETEKVASDQRELFDIQSEIEIRLMTLGLEREEGAENDDWYHYPQNLRITLRSPSGRELYIDLSKANTPRGLVWNDMDTNETYNDVLIPDSSPIMEGIKMKIEEIGGGEK